MFYKYKESLDNYQVSKRAKQFIPAYSRFEKGSYKQRVFDPLAGARRDENGTMVYSMEPKEVQIYLQEDDLREFYNAHKKFENMEAMTNEEFSVMLAEQGVDVDMMERMGEAGMPVEKWQAYIEQELSIFDEGEDYNYVKDMKDAFHESLRTSLEDRILKTIPDFAFWDIKKPIDAEAKIQMNKYNPGRRVQNENFFDARAWDAYVKEKEEQRKVAPTVTHYNNY